MHRHIIHQYTPHSNRKTAPLADWSSPDAMAKCKGGTDSTLWFAMVMPYVSGPMAVRTAIWCGW